jgi:hypothetical protein
MYAPCHKKCPMSDISTISKASNGQLLWQGAYIHISRLSMAYIFYIICMLPVTKAVLCLGNSRKI